jgi:hypothetical protein
MVYFRHRTAFVAFPAVVELSLFVTAIVRPPLTKAKSGWQSGK